MGLESGMAEFYYLGQRKVALVSQWCVHELGRVALILPSVLRVCRA